MMESPKFNFLSDADTTSLEIKLQTFIIFLWNFCYIYSHVIFRGTAFNNLALGQESNIRLGKVRVQKRQ